MKTFSGTLKWRGGWGAELILSGISFTSEVKVIQNVVNYKISLNWYREFYTILSSNGSEHIVEYVLFIITGILLKLK